MDNKYQISDELFATFLDGNTTAEETTRVLNSLANDPSQFDNMDFINNFNTMDTINNGQIGDTYNYWLQTYPDSCAIMSQKFIMDQFGITNADGTPYTEDQLVQYSAEHGYYDNGTRACDIGLLMSDAGIPCSSQESCTVFDLAHELAQGHKVIVGVDSDELWHNDAFSRLKQWFSDFFGGQADHAIVVAGIDASDPSDVKVIVDDPGSGDHHKAYPLSEFMDAWKDSTCFMCSTDIPAPSTVPGMEHFNYQQMHIPEVAGVDYDTFELIHDLNQGLINYDMSNGVSPLAELYSVFTDVADGMALSEAVSVHGIGEHIDTQVLCEAFRQTALVGIEQLQNYDSLVWDATMHGDNGQNHDIYAVLIEQANYYESIGEVDTASFMHQQAEAMNVLNTLGVEVDSDFYTFI